jgi:hypothetical protein
MNARGMTPQELQNLLDELKASRASRRRAWENLQEIRWVLTDSCGVELPPPARKTIDSEGRIVKDGVRKALRDRQLALAELVHAIRHFRQIADSKPLTLRQRIPTGRSGVELGPTVVCKFAHNPNCWGFLQFCNKGHLLDAGGEGLAGIFTGHPYA